MTPRADLPLEGEQLELIWPGLKFGLKIVWLASAATEKSGSFPLVQLMRVTLHSNCIAQIATLKYRSPILPAWDEQLSQLLWGKDRFNNQSAAALYCHLKRRATKEAWRFLSADSLVKLPSRLILKRVLRKLQLTAANGRAADFRSLRKTPCATQGRLVRLKVGQKAYHPVTILYIKVFEWSGKIR